MNYNLIRERENLERKRKKEKEMQEQFKKEIEEKKRIQKKKRKKFKIYWKSKKKTRRVKKIRRRKKKKTRRIWKKKKAEEEERNWRLIQEEIELRRIKEEKLRLKRERIRICKKMKYYIEKKDFENNGSFVSYLDETWKYWDIKTPDDLTEFKIELLKKERIDMSDKVFTTVKGRIDGALPGQVITGWKLINRYNNENEGTCDRNVKILGTNNYDFTFTSYFWRGLHWTLELYGFKFPEDYDENKDLDEYDYY